MKSFIPLSLWQGGATCGHSSYGMVFHFNKEISSDYKSRSRFFLFFEIVAWSDVFIFQLRVSCSKWNTLISNFKLVTRSKIFYISNLS